MALGDLDEDIVAPLRVHERRARLARGQHVGHHRQFVVVDGHCRSNILGLRSCRAEAHGNRFSDIAQLFNCHDRFGGALETSERGRRNDPLDADQVRRGENRLPEFFGHMNPA